MAQHNVAQQHPVPLGGSKGWSTDEQFIIINRTSASDYSVECGWVVQERMEDDYDSTTYHPFGAGRASMAKARPWVGRRITGLSVEQVPAIYAEIRAAFAERRSPQRGERIGSVTREEV